MPQCDRGAYQIKKANRAFRPDVIAIAITDHSIYFAAFICAMVCRRANSADIFASIGELPSALSIVVVILIRLISLGFSAMAAPSKTRLAR